MSPAGAKVKIVNRRKGLRRPVAVASYRRNEKSPAQDIESADSAKTQPVVVLPLRLTDKNLYRFIPKSSARPAKSFCGAVALVPNDAALPYASLHHNPCSKPIHSRDNLRPLLPSTYRDTPLR